MQNKNFNFSDIKPFHIWRISDLNKNIMKNFISKNIKCCEYCAKLIMYCSDLVVINTRDNTYTSLFSLFGFKNKIEENVFSISTPVLISSKLKALLKKTCKTYIFPEWFYLKIKYNIFSKIKTFEKTYMISHINNLKYIRKNELSAKNLKLYNDVNNDILMGICNLHSINSYINFYTSVFIKNIEKYDKILPDCLLNIIEDYCIHKIDKNDISKFISNIRELTHNVNNMYKKIL